MLQLVLVKELKQFCLPRSSDDLCLLFCINPSSMAGVEGARVEEEFSCFMAPSLSKNIIPLLGIKPIFSE